MNRLKKRFLALGVGLAVLAALAGCGAGFPMASEAKDGQGYTDGETMLVVATERNRYRDVYTDQIWEVQMDEKGVDFQEYLLGEIQDFLSELKTMNLLADEQDIRLSGQEKEQLKELAADFYGSLTAEDKTYTGADRDDVYNLYAQYHRANKLVDELTKDVNLEISDSEAKVITVQEIVLSDGDMARELQIQASAEGADFRNYAKTYSEDPEIEKPVGRSERPKEYEDPVFELEAGEVSPVIRAGDKYYIVKCISDYDEEATLERKQKLALQRKDQAFRRIYNEFAAKNRVEIRGDIWEKLSLKEGSGSTTTDFFERYREYMNQ